MNTNNSKNDFSFVVTSYNQERYVFEHLESIKYIIDNYGNGKRIQLIFSDDSSNDSTVEKAKFWIEQNKTLFNEYQIIEHEYNVGTIRNMIDAIACVDALYFKESACDDLYYKNNLFELCSNEKIVLTPTIHFFESYETEKTIAPEYIIYLYHKNTDIKKILRSMLSYSQCISSPGVFLPSFVWKNEEFKDYLRRYKYIEDIPEWDYLFNRNDYNLDVEISDNPVILYRRNIGVSENLHNKSNPVGEEYKKIRCDIKAKKDMLPKWVNPYSYVNFIRTRVMIQFYKKDAGVMYSLNKWDKNVDVSESYLKCIKTKAEASEKSYMNFVR